MKRRFVSWTVWMTAAFLLGCSGNRKTPVPEPDRVEAIRVVVGPTDSLVQEIVFTYAPDERTISGVKNRCVTNGRYIEETASYTVGRGEGVNRVERDGVTYESRLVMNPDSSVHAVTSRCVQEGVPMNLSVVCQYDSGRLVRENMLGLEERNTVSRVDHFYAWRDGNIVGVRVEAGLPGAACSPSGQRTYNYSARENTCNVDLNACWFSGLYSRNWMEMAVGLTGAKNRCLLDSVQVDTPGYEGTRKLSFVYEDDAQGRVGKVYIHFGVADYVAYLTYRERRTTQ